MSRRRTSHHRSTPPWLWLSAVAALVAVAGSLVALTDVDGIYGNETDELINQAVAQDIVNVAVVTPAILILARLTGKGSLRAYLVWVGVMAFTVYSYVIYAFSLQFGPLFLVWVAVLGLSLFALIGGLASIDPAAVRARTSDAPTRLAGWFLVIVAFLFALVWLKDIVPALWAGTTPATVQQLGLPTNPVHVLDLSFFLPAALAIGIQLLRKHPLAYQVAPGLIAFLLLTSLPVFVTPFVAEARGGTPAWPVLGPIGLIAIASAIILVRLVGASGGRQASPAREGWAQTAVARRARTILSMPQAAPYIHERAQARLPDTCSTRPSGPK